MTDGRRNSRTLAPTKVPGLAKPPAGITPGLQKYLSSLSEAVEIRLGRKGDPRDRAITLRELIESGLAKELTSAPFDPNNPGTDLGPVDPDNQPNLAVPTAPLGFTADGGYSIVILGWDLPTYSNHSLTEIWRHTSDVLGDALLVGVQVGTVYIDPVGESADFYYWVRFVNTEGVPGPFNNNAGTQATTATNTATLLAELEASIPAVAFAAGIEPVGVVNTLPSVSGYAGPTTVVLTTDGKLYRLFNGSWTAAVPTVDLTGTISELQIADDAVTNAKIAVNAIQGAVIAANAITETKITNSAISSAKIQANAIVAGKIATNAVTANKIQANAVTANKIQTNAVTASKIQANAITAVKINADAVTANKIATNAVTADAIATGSITAGAIAAGAINAQNIIANGVIIGDKIAGNTIQASKIQAGSIGADRLAAGSVTAAKVGTNQIITNTANIGTGVITTANIQNATITAADIGTAEIVTAKIDGEAVTVPDSALFQATNAQVSFNSFSNSSVFNAHTFTVDHGPGWDDIGSVIIWGALSCGGVLGTNNNPAGIYCRLSYSNGTGGRGQLQYTTDRPGRGVAFHCVGKFPAPSARNMSYSIQVTSVYPGSSFGGGYWQVKNGSMVVLGGKR